MRATTVFALALVVGTLGCREDAVNATPGVLHVNLTTPNSGLDGGAVIVLSVPSTPVSVTPAAGLEVWGSPVEAPRTTIALTGVLNAGTILTLQVPDINLASRYSATLREVASGDSTVAVRALAGYSLSVDAP